MSFDLYAANGSIGENTVDALVQGRCPGIKDLDVATRIRLLAGIDERGKNGGYKSLVHASRADKSDYVINVIEPGLAHMDRLGLKKPVAPDMSRLLPGAWFLQFTFTLTKPWMSRDDDLFYVVDSVNPVRKDKVFKVPFMSAAAWKGFLRWTAMRIELMEEQDPCQFAGKRLYQALLFGDEKGEESGQNSDFAGYLDGLLPEAREPYECLFRQYYQLQEKSPIPHHSGRLMFYPTYFNLIGLEVINPHSRKTRAGTHPIYLECVPTGAQGVFSLIYVPFDLHVQDGLETFCQAAKGLRLIAEAISSMMLVYGFSAKRSSGYGLAKEGLDDGTLQIHLGGSQQLKYKYGSFIELCKRSEEAAAVLQQGGGE
jgi:CRISPR-associated protein Cmr2